MKYDPFIYGKNQTEGVVSVEIEDGSAILYTETGSTKVPNEYYILYTNKENDNCVELSGGLYYRWGQKFSNKKEYQAAIGKAKGMGTDYYTIYNPKEAFMVKSGVTYYKGMSPSDVSVLSFDIETTGLIAETNKLLLITNTFRTKNKTVTRLFSIEDFKSEQELVYAWASFVNDCDPSILVGHNIFGFDLPFLRHKGKGKLPIGKLRQDAKFAANASQFRKDGSQSYDYFNVLVPGREVVDTFHLSLKYDTGRNYPSYGLKAIVKHEGIERKDRQHYDAINIGNVYNKLMDDKLNPALIQEWEKIKKYAEHDADDALALFDLMIPSYFYYCQHIPKTMQQVVNSATGSQINSFMVRAYITEGHSIPKADDSRYFEGAISFGIPGIYKNVLSVDFHAHYPQIIKAYKLYDRHKDPKGYMLRMTEFFSSERVKYKKLFKETRDPKYNAMQEAFKIIANSIYGFCGAPGLNFNSMKTADRITELGRELLNKICIVATGKDTLEWKKELNG